ncbi:hypothetical protein CPT_MarsHill_049 [Staphylococcus phage MarsHill]|nr:hypothetical protein CPT_MarsHill_049 [Staphylococcus phage MarsHill]QQO92705.1 hypothetical protein CPT_Madawaska_048 [Staphylococcus phage Madawaska]
MTGDNKNNDREDNLSVEEANSLVIKLYYFLKQFKYYITPIFLSVYSLVYGFQFVFRTREAYRTSDIYVAISNFMDLKTYGVFLIIGGLALAASLFLDNFMTKPLMTIGAFINFALFLIYAILSLDSAGMQSTIILKIFISFLNLFFAVFTILEMRMESIINGRR